MAVHVKNSAAAVIAAAVLFAALAVGWLYWRGGGTPLDAEWVRYRDRFMSAQGRIVDEGRGGISTSEGQGFGMLLAVAYNDRIAFDKLWAWTKENLGTRKDRLFVWKWEPGKTPAPDTVNATDGDLLIAWALARAATKWNDQSFTDEAIRRARSIRSFEALAREIKKKFYLAPDINQPENGSGIVVNPSYIVFPVFRDLDVIDPNWIWGQFTHTGLRLLEAARFGPHKLPPDWLIVRDDGTYALPEKVYDRVAGYEAVRVPLYLMWANLADEELLRPFAEAWTKSRKGREIGIVFDLDTGEVKTRNNGTGFRAIERAVDCVLTGYPVPAELRLTPHDDYYSASLFLLTLTMLQETHPTCLSARD
ncbi:MAG: cellulase [Alphaproteobacteria bacterium]|nr:cellulase [Alphaproteobacteria bacterium]